MSKFIERLDELRKVRDTASQGNWEADWHYEPAVGRSLQSFRATGPIHRQSPRADIFKRAESDADFIALAANEWNALIESCRVMREALEAIQRSNELRMDDHADLVDALARADAILLGDKR